MANLTEAFPDSKTLLSLEPEELGDVMLELIHKGISCNPGMFGISDFLDAINARDTPEWPFAVRAQVTQAIVEALAWLEHAGFVIPDPTQTHSTYWRRLSRRGQRLRSRQQAATYREAAILPVSLIHPAILERSQAAFMRGDHDIAVFSAFKTIEVAVRKAGGYEECELGTKLMRKAFEPTKGPLADKTLENGEQQAQSDLFAGAIGAAKNPTSHREVEMSKIEAARLILFASQLMSIVEARTR
jgi:uncharacterized protein (TIGR02391 family)